MTAGWRTERLGEVCSFLNRGISPKYLEEGGVCVLNQKCVRDHEVNFDLARRHDSSSKTVSLDRFVRGGDVLINSTGTGTLGRVAQLRETPNEPTTVDSHVTIARPKPGLFFPEFFGYMLILIEEAIKQSGEGCGGQTELSRSVLAEKFLVSYPASHSEQQRIVAILDEAFEGIATAKANTEKNLQNARAIFESHLQSLYSGAEGGWLVKPLSELCYDGRVITYGVVQLGQEVPGGVPCLRTSNVRWLRIETAGMKRISRQISDGYSRTILKGGEVLVSVRGTLGGVAVASPEMSGWNVSREVAVAPVDPDKVNPHFVAYCIGSGVSQEWLGGMKKGAAYVGINIEDLRNLPIRFPSPEEQDRLVRHLDAVSVQVDSLASTYRQKVVALDDLKKSLLHHAFSGQL